MCTSQLPVAHFHHLLHHYRRHYHMPSHHVSRKTYPPQKNPHPASPCLTPTAYELICQEQDRSVPLPLPLIAAPRQLLKWEQEIRWVGGMRYRKLNWDLICDGISKHAAWRGAGNTLGGMSSPSGQTIALRLCKQFLITSVWLTGDFDPRPRHK